MSKLRTIAIALATLACITVPCLASDVTYSQACKNGNSNCKIFFWDPKAHTMTHLAGDAIQWYLPRKGTLIWAVSFDEAWTSVQSQSGVQ